MGIPVLKPPATPRPYTAWKIMPFCRNIQNLLYVLDYIFRLKESPQVIVSASTHATNILNQGSTVYVQFQTLPVFLKEP